MLESVSGQCGVIRLDIEFEMFFKPVGAQEGDSSGHVEIVLMLGRFLRFRLDQKLPLETDLLRVIDRHLQKRGQEILLALEVGVEKSLITFPSAPKNIILA